MADNGQSIQSLRNVTSSEALRMEEEASKIRVLYQIVISGLLLLILVLNWVCYFKDFYERYSFMIAVSVTVLIGRIIVVLFIKFISELVFQKCIEESQRIISNEPENSTIGKDSLADLQLSFPS